MGKRLVRDGVVEGEDGGVAYGEKAVHWRCGELLAGHDRAWVGVGDETAGQDHEGAGGVAYAEVRVVRAEEDETALAARAPEAFADMGGGHGVEALRRLVEQQDGLAPRGDEVEGLQLLLAQALIERVGHGEDVGAASKDRFP